MTKPFKNRIYGRVYGSPFQPGDLVRVCQREYNCGCGQTFPGDPMIGVRFGTLPMSEFWSEELEQA